VSAQFRLECPAQVSIEASGASTIVQIKITLPPNTGVDNTLLRRIEDMLKKEDIYVGYWQPK
jgi:hypothetical protein